MFRDEIWISERRNVFKKRVRPHLTHCLKIKHANKLEPVFLGDVRPNKYTGLDSVFESWWYESEIVDWAFQLMPFESFKERLDYYIANVASLDRCGWAAISPTEDNFLLGWSEEEEDKWFDYLYSDYFSSTPALDVWQKKYSANYPCFLWPWVTSLLEYFLGYRFIGYRFRGKCLIRDGAFCNRRLDWFFRMCSMLDSSRLVRGGLDGGLGASHYEIKALCKLSVDYEAGFHYMRSKLAVDGKYFFRVEFEGNGDLAYKMEVLSIMRGHFSKMPEFAEMYDAAVNTKTWDEYYSL